MRNLIGVMIILRACLVLAVEKLIRRPVADAHGLTDALTDQLTERGFKTWLQHDAHLDSTTLMKARHLSPTSSAHYKAVMPYVPSGISSIQRSTHYTWKDCHNDNGLCHTVDAAKRPRGSLVISRGFFDKLFGNEPKEPEEPPEYVDNPPVDLDVVAESTFLRGRDLARCYLASRDGWSAREFHRKCDFKGPTIIVAKVKRVLRSPLIIGGYMPLEFKSSDDYIETRKDFLFVDKGGKSGIAFVTKSGNGPVYDYARGGPQWGSDGLIIGAPLAPVGGGFAGPSSETTGIGSLKSVSSRLGLDYEKLDGADSLLGNGVKRGELEDVEVYFSPEIARR
eukprot:gnl/MRDRNA2_/MRDRNA2_110765_c0_seq1.p1 gnl/MRDRNA2_/MRDRNA2_110765_c0~~gnl/MRDRNA2_/MRDRNA2_110765_c0_seq1.p1  ORF type:complete len:337 (-),score=53.15 gnl/MRDRNA2_/MRDRNA2_110765_c0_seq1:4-1014(-)